MTDLEIIEIAKPYSMTASRNLQATVDCVRYLDGLTPHGDVVECGVWRGGHIVAAMLAAVVQRTYWLFDTFNGMTEPGPQDFRKGYHASQSTKYRKKGASHWCRAPLDEVKHNVSQHQKTSQPAIYVAGPVEQTLIADRLPTRIALLRLDTDFYSSTKTELEVLWPRVVTGGVMIVDDYGSWNGCRQACDEYFGADFIYTAIDPTAIKVIKT